jgi:tight adherence protein B
VRWRAAARRHARERALADLVAALGAPLRAGVPAAVAVAAAAPTFRDDPELGLLLRELSDAASRGASVAEVWRRHALAVEQPDADLSFVARAWALSELAGAPLADALACGEQVLRTRARARERLAAAASGPRASMAVLCLLPASGPVVGVVMGVDPVSLYFSSPVATGSLVLGISLGLSAWLWSRRILRRAA